MGHINNVLKDNEVDEKSNVQKMHIAILIRFFAIFAVLYFIGSVDRHGDISEMLTF